MTGALYGLMAKFNWTPAEIREIEIPTLMVIYWGLELEAKDAKRRNAMAKASMPRMRRSRRR